MKSFFSILCFRIVLLQVIFITAVSAQPGKPAGTLFIIGGGSISDSLRMQLLQCANWKKGDRIVVVTLASGVSDESFASANKAFKKLTGEDCIKFDSAAINSQSKLNSLRNARIIYLGGGSQDRFMQLIADSPVKQIIKEAYYNGALIGGSSAGAAVMSRKMITGHGLRDTAYASTFKVLQKGNLEIKEGLGLLDSVIIDQHFVYRSRYNRLLSAIMEYPGYQCFGIDESTAVIIQNGMATVAGQSQVILFSKPQDIHIGNKQAFGASAVSLSIFIEGEKFAVKK